MPHLRLPRHRCRQNLRHVGVCEIWHVDYAEDDKMSQETEKWVRMAAYQREFLALASKTD